MHDIFVMEKLKPDIDDKCWSRWVKFINPYTADFKREILFAKLNQLYPQHSGAVPFHWVLDRGLHPLGIGDGDGQLAVKLQKDRRRMKPRSLLTPPDNLKGYSSVSLLHGLTHRDPPPERSS